MGGSIRRPVMNDKSGIENASSKVSKVALPAPKKNEIHVKSHVEPKADCATRIKSSHPVLREVAGYSIGHRLGSGSFGEVYYGYRGREEVAIKVEPKESSSLKKEWKFYQKLSGGPGVPKAYFFGTIGEYNVLVMDLLGPSLDDLFKQCGKQFSLKTVLSVADQVLTILQFLHSRGIVHRDLKKQNLCIGRGANAGTIYIVDFGLSACYVNGATNMHIKDRQTGKVVGTPLYCSVNAHTGREQSRRDDMESLGYVLVGLFQGDLPWRKAGRRGLAESKRMTSAKTLCQGLPAEFNEYFRICRNLDFETEPPYSELRKLMQAALARETKETDKRFDWSIDNSVHSESTRCPSQSLSN